MTKEQRKIKELTATNEQLQNEKERLKRDLDEAISSKNYWSNEHSKIQKELNELHDTFDLLGVPRKKQTKDYAPDLSLSNRMTLYVAGVKARITDEDMVF